MNPVGVLLSVVAGLVAIVAVVGIYNGITARLNEGESIELLNQLRANVERIYSGQASYGTGGSLVPIVGGFGKIPDGARIGSGNTATIVHPFGGAVEIEGNAGRFSITFEDLDDETCKDLGQAYAGRTRAGSGIVRIIVGGGAPGNARWNQPPLVRDIAYLNTNCNNGSAGNNLTFVFG